MNKIPCSSKNTETLTDLDSFHLLLSIQLTIFLIQECINGSMVHPLSHIYVKEPVYFAETAPNSIVNRDVLCVVVFDRQGANADPTLNTAFVLTNDHAK
ncbi:hypothetical protein TNCV_2363421 [Trichonephila clavipes]|nr:hypothetical protein TNCV_2363421 [Trichonephila clavipes]